MDELASTSQPNRKEAHNARGPAEHPKEHGEGKIGLDTDIRRQRSDKNSTFQITGKFCKVCESSPQELLGC
jgi:predicted HNH restriction endonuclease